MNLIWFFGGLVIVSSLSLLASWWWLRRQTLSAGVAWQTWENNLARGLEVFSSFLLARSVWILRLLALWLIAALHWLVSAGRRIFTQLDHWLGRRRLSRMSSTSGSVSLFLAEVRQHRDRAVRERLG